MWTSLVVCDTTEVDYDGSDNDEHTRAISRRWLKGRRFLNTKRGRIALYNVCASYDVADALTDEYHKGRRVLRLMLAVIALILAKVRSVLPCCQKSAVPI